MVEENGFNVTIRMGDGSRKEVLEIYPDESAQDIINAAREQWKLGGDIEYQLFNTRTSQGFAPNTMMSNDVVQADDTLELHPQIKAA